MRNERIQHIVLNVFYLAVIALFCVFMLWWAAVVLNCLNSFSRGGIPALLTRVRTLVSKPSIETGSQNPPSWSAVLLVYGGLLLATGLSGVVAKKGWHHFQALKSDRPLITPPRKDGGVGR